MALPKRLGFRSQLCPPELSNEPITDDGRAKKEEDRCPLRWKVCPGIRCQRKLHMHKEDPGVCVATNLSPYWAVYWDAKEAA